MPKSSVQDVTAVVRQILDEAETGASPAVERLRDQAATASPAARAELLQRVREKNLPLFASTTDLAPPVAVQ